MKATITNLLSIISIFAFVGCTSDYYSDLDIQTVQKTYEEEGFLLTRSNEDFDNKWEKLEEVTLADGQKLRLPWKYEGESPVSYSIRNDVKKEDGWIMLSHSIYSPIYLNVPVKYIALYNMASGDIKIFLIPTRTIEQHNNAFWTVYFTKAQSWMNSLNEVTLPTSYKFQPEFVWRTSVRNYDDKTSLENGWNVLLIPDVAYDPNPPGELGIQIGTKSYTTTHLELLGETNGTINGKLINVGYKNPTDKFKSEIVSYTGDAAETLLKKIFKIQNDSTKNDSTRAVGTLIAGSIASGIT